MFWSGKAAGLYLRSKPNETRDCGVNGWVVYDQSLSILLAPRFSEVTRHNDQKQMNRFNGFLGKPLKRLRNFH